MENIEKDKKIREYQTEPQENVCSKDHGWINDMEIIRTGSCEPKTCNAACCRIYMINRIKQLDDYISGFIPNKDDFGNHFLSKDCKHLSSTGKCSVWGTEEMPEACKQFPNPGDSVYNYVYEKCSFRFELKPKN